MPSPVSVLVVEDTDACEPLVRLLRASGHPSAGCNDAASARAALDDAIYDLVLIDVTLLRASDLARSARELEPRPYVVGLVGGSAPKTERDAFDRVVQKPLVGSRLVDVLREAAERR